MQSFVASSLCLLGFLVHVSLTSATTSEEDIFRHLRKNVKGDDAKQRDLQSLLDIWDISDVNFYPSGENQAQLTLTFSTSDRLERDNLLITIVSGNDCISSFNESTFDVSLSEPGKLTLEEEALGRHKWEVLMNIEETLALEGGDNVFNQSLPDDTLESFCVRIATLVSSAGNEDKEARIILETAWLVELDLGSTSPTMNAFEFEFPEPPPSTAPPRLPEASIFFCDSDNIEVDPHPLINRGDPIRLCVLPPDGYDLETVERFRYLEVDDENNVIAFQEAVLEGGLPSSPLNELDCSKDLCVISSILNSAFFDYNVQVEASGFVSFRNSNDTDEPILNSTKGEDDTLVVGSTVNILFETLLRLIPPSPPSLGSTDGENKSSNTSDETGEVPPTSSPVTTAPTEGVPSDSSSSSSHSLLEIKAVAVFIMVFWYGDAWLL